LEILSGYFDPNGEIPKPTDLGLALEGGGSKAASFELGVLAGLHELGLLTRQVRAISSVSGGSYAASYYYNRLYDSVKNEPDAGNEDEWFTSCIPDHLIKVGTFDEIAEQAAASNCWERTTTARDVTPGDIKRYGLVATQPPEERYRDLVGRYKIQQLYNEFDVRYQFLGHVWKNHDVLRGITAGNLRTEEDLRLAEEVNLGLLATESAATMPFQVVGRTAFRWPFNTAPSRLAYRLGLERQYSFSPHDWKEAAEGTNEGVYVAARYTRRKTRLLADLRQQFQGSQASGETVPFWIIGAAAPGYIGLRQWIDASPRDPLRQPFELTWSGYGSGIYGYAKQPPDGLLSVVGRNSNGLSVTDAVVASAAFFDDDQSKVIKQPLRYVADLGQHFLNVTFFSELRNFNVSDTERAKENILPWPLYITSTTSGTDNAYIHLQDGGNTENSGILPLLRRGYRVILYAHGTQDEKAEWESICHLKNHLELDGAYFLRSPDLEALMKDSQASPKPSEGRPISGQFRSYLDGICSMQLDRSDLVAYDANP